MSNFLTGSLLRKLREESNYSLQVIIPDFLSQYFA